MTFTLRPVQWTKQQIAAYEEAVKRKAAKAAEEAAAALARPSPTPSFSPTPEREFSDGLDDRYPNRHYNHDHPHLSYPYSSYRGHGHKRTRDEYEADPFYRSPPPSINGRHPGERRPSASYFLHYDNKRPGSSSVIVVDERPHSHSSREPGNYYRSQSPGYRHASSTPLPQHHRSSGQRGTNNHNHNPYPPSNPHHSRHPSGSSYPHSREYSYYQDYDDGGSPLTLPSGRIDVNSIRAHSPLQIIHDGASSVVDLDGDGPRRKQRRTPGTQISIACYFCRKRKFKCLEGNPATGQVCKCVFWFLCSSLCFFCLSSLLPIPPFTPHLMMFP